MLYINNQHQIRKYLCGEKNTNMVYYQMDIRAL